jgi:hypothetical protein
LKLHPLAIYDNRSYFEVNADCRNVAAAECVVGKSNEQRAFAYSCKRRKEKKSILSRHQHVGCDLTAMHRQRLSIYSRSNKIYSNDTRHAVECKTDENSSRII